MKLKRFYKTQREVAEVVKYLVDSYWNNETNEDELFERIQQLLIDNPGKMIKSNDFTTVLKQQCGKRRLEVIERIIKLK